MAELGGEVDGAELGREFDMAKQRDVSELGGEV